jgi:hypothetical protein
VIHLAELQAALAGLATLNAKPVMTAVFRYVGLSTTTRPSTAPDGSALAAGTVFDALDSGDRYLWDGSLWRRQDPALQPAQGSDLALLVAAVNAAADRLTLALAAEFRSLKQSLTSGLYVETQDPTAGQ